MLCGLILSPIRAKAVPYKATRYAHDGEDVIKRDNLGEYHSQTLLRFEIAVLTVCCLNYL